MRLESLLAILMNTLVVINKQLDKNEDYNIPFSYYELTHRPDDDMAICSIIICLIIITRMLTPSLYNVKDSRKYRRDACIAYNIAKN